MIKKFFKILQLWLKKRELKKVVKAAIKLNEATGRKILIVQTEDGLRFISKADFKDVWRKTPGMKKRSIQQWERECEKWYQVYEDLKPENKFINSN